MFDVPIFDSEKADGLLERIKAESSARVLSKVTFPDQTPDLETVIAKLKSSSKTMADALEGVDQPDLVFIASILVSTGWNKNDDIFVPGETLAAKDTPVHKPINIGHDDERIIGHIIESKTLTKDGDSFEVDAEDKPDDFDIEVGGVLYSMLPAHREEISEIIDSVNEGTAFVSMECWFKDFAYGFKDPKTGVTKIVARQEDTAFLTKHLRVYGGTGKFKGYELGRVMLDFVFGGMGVVDNPANPESIIKEVRQSNARYEKVEIDQITKGGVNRMAKENKELETQLEEAQSALKAMEDAKAKLQSQHDTVAGELEKANAKVEELTGTVGERDESITATVSC